MTGEMRFNRRTFVAAGAAAMAGIAMAGRATSAQQPVLSTDPMQAAVEISQLENIEHIPGLYRLYEHMHPDSQEIVPPFAMVGWYKADFQPRKPAVAVATGVTYRDDWVWGVNGKTYAGTAEVSYTQQFGDGSVANDVVRLVQHQGSWKWFFGRDRAWVDEQIVRFDQRQHVKQDAEAPYNLQYASPYVPEMLDTVPHRLSVENYQDAFVLEPAPVNETTATSDDPGPVGYIYRAEREYYTMGVAFVEPLQPNQTASEFVDERVYAQMNLQPMTLRAWNLEPRSGNAWALFEHMGSDAVGNMQSLVVSDGANALTLAGVSDEMLGMMAAAIAPTRP